MDNNYQVGDIFTDDAEYSARAKWCNENGKIIMEIESSENGERLFQIQEIPQPTQKQLAEIEIDSLRNWFNGYYAEHEQKYRRLYSMRIYCDDGSDPYQQLMLLYQTAEKNRKRIQELESQYGIE